MATQTKIFFANVGARYIRLFDISVIDAFGKPGPGLMDYSITMVGNYDECIAIKADRYADPDTKQGLDHPYTGKYCTGFIQLTGSQVGSCFCSLNISTSLNFCQNKSRGESEKVLSVYK